MEEYCEGFLENGYDDLETVKLIEREDLIAIGVSRSDHQEYLLASVRILRERGAAWVYLVFTDQTNGASEFVEVILQIDARKKNKYFLKYLIPYFP